MTNRYQAGTLPIRMLHDRLLVEPETDSAERQSTAGLVIPATAVGPKRLAWATVVAKGEHVRQVDVGDRVLYDPEERAEVDLARQGLRAPARARRARRGRARRGGRLDGPVPVGRVAAGRAVVQFTARNCSFGFR